MNIATYTCVENVKDSGVTWFGEVPSHWQVKRLRHLTKKVGSGITPTGGALTYVDDGIPLLRSQNVLFGRIELEGAARISERVHQRMSNSQVAKGDILLNITGGSIGRCHFVDTEDDLNVNQHVCIIRPNGDIISQYLNFLLSSEVGQKQIWFWQQGGGREGLNFEAIKGFAFAIPPLSEQRAIAGFLDGKCAKIDEAVRIKEEQIKLLRERRQILIQNAVTRGLNPDAPMKDSGIDWIGQIPAHWEVIPLKRMFFEKNRRTRTGEETLLSLRMNVGLVPHDDVSDKAISDADLVDYKMVDPGQLVMNRMRASIGLFGIAEQAGLVSPDYAVFDARSDLFAPFFLNLFKLEVVGARFRLSSRGLGTGSSGFMRLYTDDFGAISVPVPPTAEQKDIVQHISEVSRQIGSAISIKESQVTKLKEYKTSLINTAVTGKIKVI